MTNTILPKFELIPTDQHHGHAYQVRNLTDYTLSGVLIHDTISNYWIAKDSNRNRLGHGVTREIAVGWFVPEPTVINGIPADAVQCEWFAVCNNDATHYRNHPVLGYVPRCDRCKARGE